MLQPDNDYYGQVNNFAETHQDFKKSDNTDQPFKSRRFLAKVLKVPDIPIPDNPSSESQEDTLYLEQNDIIVIEGVQNDGWFLARSDQVQGRVPADSCQVLDDQIPWSLCQYLVDNSFFDIHVCFASFVAQDVGDLSITKGDIIVATNAVNEHWMQGQVCFDGQTNSWPRLVVGQQIGSFPLNHCWRLDSGRVKDFCHDKLKEHVLLQRQNHQQPQQPPQLPQQQFRPVPPRPPFISTAHSSSLSSGSSSLHSSDYQHNQHLSNPPPKPQQPPERLVQSALDQPNQKSGSLLTLKQQDKLKGWIHTVKKKTARLSTRITASLGLISLTRDEEFERHYETFKHIEKTIRAFIKNLATFVEHFENFLLSLQVTSDNLTDFYRDKSHRRELEELKKKNKALVCEHFHAFRRTIDRQVIAVASQLLQKYSGPQQLINKRSAKLLDYDNKTKEVESCRDLEKKEALRDQYVIAKDLYDRINRQLIQELPLFNQYALDIFKECILVLLESRRNLILSYTRQTASLLDTPLMLTYTASDVVSSILMSCEQVEQNTHINELVQQDRKDSAQTSGHDTKQNSANDDDLSRSQSATSQLSSDFHQMALAAREISSTPLSQVSDSQNDRSITEVKRPQDEPDGGLNSSFKNCLEAERNQVRNKPNEMNSEDGDSRPADRQETQKGRKKKKFQIYVASWPFVATGPNQLTIVCKQPLKLIKGCDECGNSDWSLVQDKKGQLGYVPSSYIKKKE